MLKKKKTKENDGNFVSQRELFNWSTNANEDHTPRLFNGKECKESNEMRDNTLRSAGFQKDVEV